MDAIILSFLMPHIEMIKKTKNDITITYLGIVLIFFLVDSYVIDHLLHSLKPCALEVIILG